METEDLLRGLGILIDNAMEAVPQTDGTVRIVLLQEEKELYIAVSNNYEKSRNYLRFPRRVILQKELAGVQGLPVIGASYPDVKDVSQELI